jgi:hypothetical protein
MSRIAIQERPIWPRQDKQVTHGGAGKIDAEHLQLGRGYGARWAEVGEPGDPGKHPIEEELRRQRRNRQIEAFDPQRRQTEQDADNGGAQARQQQRHQQIDLRDAGHEIVSGVGPHRHEAAGAERNLPAIADEDVQAYCCKRQN